MLEATWTLAIAIALQTAGAASPQGLPLQAASAEVWTDDRPIVRLFPNLARDLKALPTVRSAAAVTAGGMGAAAISGADTRFANWSAGAGDSAYTRTGAVLGNGWVQAGGAMATYAVGKLANHAEAIHLGSDLIRAHVLNSVVTAAIKFTADRARPSGGQYAFPSGHSSATFASAATIHAHYGWKAGLPAFATAGFVAWTRVRDRAHWLSDVTFGATIGIVTARAVAAKHKPGKVGVTLSPTKGGAAIFFSIR